MSQRRGRDEVVGATRWIAFCEGVEGRGNPGFPLAGIAFGEGLAV
jgi:hypothetical protein